MLREVLGAFYGEQFIPTLPPDVAITPVSRTIDSGRLVDESVVSFTHTTDMPWMLPGVAPIHRRVEIPVVIIVGFSEGKIAYEHIYWDRLRPLPDRTPCRRRAAGFRSGDGRLLELSGTSTAAPSER
jgi:hypothetical protein